MLQYINSPEADFSRGIDVRSSENQISPGFVLDLQNADVIEKRVRKRKGTQGYAGNVPVRITKLEYDQVTGEALFTLDSAVSLDSSVSLETVRSSPVVVYGRSSNLSTGPFNTAGDSVRYYSAFSVPTRKVFSAPSGTLEIPATEHGLGTENLFIAAVEATSTSDRSYTKVLTDSLSIDDSTFDVSIDYTTAVNRNVYVYFADKDPVAGNSYVTTLNHTGSGSETFSIPTSTHNLNTISIIPQISEIDGADHKQVIPDSLTVATNGDVSITINSVAAVDYSVILSAAPVLNQAAGSVNARSSGTVSITNPDTPWVFFGIFLEQTPGGTKELVYPDAVNYDAPTNTFNLSFTNESNLARNFIVVYEYGAVRSNQLAVEDSDVTVSGTDEAPQLTLWGLDHSEIYVTKEAREGWVNHIDSYRRSGEQRLVCGLGGNFFTAQEYLEAASTYLYPTLYPDLFARASVPVILGPVFWDTGENPERTRGYITGDNSGTNWATVTAVSYDTDNGFTKYTISVPNKQILDSAGVPTTLSSVISTGGNLNDYLTVQQMSWTQHEGTFRIRQVQDGTDEIYIWVENSNNSSDFDDSGVGGSAGIFTDQISWLDPSPFVPQDLLSASALPDIASLVVESVSSMTNVVSGADQLIEVPAGVVFSGTRTSFVIPLREAAPSNTPSVENLVRGDMLTYSEIARELRVKYINTDQNRTIDISGDGETATATLQSGSTSFLAEGNYVLLYDAGAFSGQVQISTILSDTEFQFLSTIEVDVEGATLLGKTMEVDEALTWKDTSGDQVQFQVARRWIPVEAPDDSYDLSPNATTRYFDTDIYSDQKFLRSTMVVDNMYLTNGRDEVHKFDGSSLYKAGLPEWQPGLFITQDTAATAKIVVDNRSIAYTIAPSYAAGSIEITAADVNTIPEGSTVLLSGDTRSYTIRAYSSDSVSNKYYVKFDRALDAGVDATGSISEIATYRYYFRLNMVDANENIIASAVAQSQDYVVQLTQNAAVNLALVGLPAFGNFDYDRIEVQIYRTKQGQPAPFYLVTTLPLNFNNTTGYIHFQDAFSDTDLTELDIVNTALKGQELGTGFTGPLISKYVTSIGNRKVLAHVLDYPQLDVQIVSDATLSNSTLAGDTLLFRRSNLDTGTTTDMVNRVTYEWKNGTTDDASSFVIGTDDFSFDVAGAVPAVGNWVYLSYAAVGTASRDLEYAGWWQVASVAGSTVTVNLTGAAAAGSYPDKYTIATDARNVPVLLGADGNLGMINGDSFDTFDSMRRMAMAINATMRLTDVSITGQETFTPWLLARGGNDIAPAGRLIVRQVCVESVTPELVPTFSGYSLFVNSILRSSEDQISASKRLYPSRLIASYQNYPEIFDNPTAILDVDSESAIDVNSADGQEITGIIPFFGQTAFTAAQQAAVLVVFKTNSIYLVDLNEKALGNNPVQRIETEGLGCTAPYSIAVTKKGINFANDSGIYCLRRDQSIQYIGKYMERNWTEKVDLRALDLVQGHHFGIGRAYKLSVPYTEETSVSIGYVENSRVFVYNHTNEEETGLGAWGTYSNHPATGWANLASNAFYARTDGRVFGIRSTGLLSDYRDDSSPVEFSLITRPNDFGNSSIRKVVDKIVINYRSSGENVGTSLNYAVDIEEEYSPSTQFQVNTNVQGGTGMSDPVAKAMVTIQHSVSRRRCVYFNVEIENSTIDEDIEVAGIEYRVGGLGVAGITAAADTDK